MTMQCTEHSAAERFRHLVENGSQPVVSERKLLPDYRTENVDFLFFSFFSSFDRSRCVRSLLTSFFFFSCGAHQRL